MHVVAMVIVKNMEEEVEHAAVLRSIDELC